MYSSVFSNELFLCVCWAPSSISRHALGEFFPCVDYVLLLPSVKDQVVVIQVLQKFFLHQQRVWKMLSAWLSFHSSAFWNDGRSSGP